MFNVPNGIKHVRGGKFAKTLANPIVGGNGIAVSFLRSSNGELRLKVGCDA